MGQKLGVLLKYIRIWWPCISPIAIFYIAHAIIYFAIIDAHPSHETLVASPVGNDVELWSLRIASIVCTFVFWRMWSKVRFPTRQNGILRVETGLLVIAFAAALQVLLINFATASRLVSIPPHITHQEPFALTVRVLFGVVLSPILEGFMFRGVIFNRLTAITSQWQAVLISSVMVGLLHTHTDALTFVGAMTFGIVFALIYICFRRLWLCVVAHMIVNFLVANVAILTFLQSTALRFPVVSVALPITVIIGLVVLIFKRHPTILAAILDK